MADEMTDEEKAFMETGEAEQPEVVEEVTEEVVEEQPAEETPEPEPKPEPEPAPEDDVKPPKGFVPYNALYQERQQRQEAERLLAEYRQQIEAARKPEQPEAPEMPDPIMDPQGFQEWTRQQWQQRDEQSRQYEQQRLQEAQQQRMAQHVNSDEAAFVKENADYYDAVDHLRKERADDLRAMGAQDAQIAQILQAETMSLIQGALQSGMSPAKVAYDLAKRRGYAGKAPAADPMQLRAKAEAAHHTGSLSKAGGPAAAGKLTLKDMASMSEKEVGMHDKDLKSLLGG